MTDRIHHIPENAGIAVDKGRQRHNNEDSAAALDAELVIPQSEKSVGIYAVADGMGGHRKGEVASKLAIQAAVREIVDRITETSGEATDEYQDWLTNAFETANRSVYGEDPEIGTTLVVALVIGDQAYVANVGDSRAYLITQQGIYQITQDQRLVDEMVKHGIISEEDAKDHPFRNVLSQAIGTSEEVDVNQTAVEFDEGNYLLLCTDGLSEELDSDTIFAIVRSAASPQAGCDALVAAANEAGGHDNISVVLVHLKRSVGA